MPFLLYFQVPNKKRHVRLHSRFFLTRQDSAPINGSLPGRSTPCALKTYSPVASPKASWITSCSISTTPTKEKSTRTSTTFSDPTTDPPARCRGPTKAISPLRLHFSPGFPRCPALASANRPLMTARYLWKTLVLCYTGVTWSLLSKSTYDASHVTTRFTSRNSCDCTITMTSKTEFVICWFRIIEPQNLFCLPYYCWCVQFTAIILLNTPRFTAIPLFIHPLTGRNFNLQKFWTGHFHLLIELKTCPRSLNDFCSRVQCRCFGIGLNSTDLIICSVKHFCCLVCVVLAAALMLCSVDVMCACV